MKTKLVSDELTVLTFKTLFNKIKINFVFTKMQKYFCLLSSIYQQLRVFEYIQILLFCNFFFTPEMVSIFCVVRIKITDLTNHENSCQL